MSWTNEVWAQASGIYARILEHPFITELAAGTLSAGRFERYIAQDELYLGNYGRQMFAFCELLSDPSEHDMFQEFARSGMEGEKIMHELLISRFGIKTDVKPSAVTTAYNSHSQAAIDSGSLPVALAALLPCMWVYNEVGLHILGIASLEGNPYKEWILEYGNEEFTAGVRTVLAMADKYAALASAEVREQMTRQFLEATQMEYDFWDYGYNGSIRELGEFGLIDIIKQQFHTQPEGVRGIGDDCAILPQVTGQENLVSTDMLVEGSHFLLNDISAWQLGWKSAAVNISDIAAMGGKPTATFLSLALPKNLSVTWAEEFIQGYKAISEQYGVPLLGGDTTSSPDRLCINVTVLGTCPCGSARLRSAAKVGDLICVTGSLGDSAAGLKVILDGLERTESALTLVRRHYEPKPRVSEGLALAATEGVHAMMDISDGIGSDLRHILKASGVCAQIDTDSLPLSAEVKELCARYGYDPVELSTCGGEDYELLFTASPETIITIPHTVIGRIVAGTDASIEWLGAGRDYMGFRHF